MHILLEAIGWVGMGLMIAGYALVSFKKLDSRSLTYQWMNIFGGTFLGINACYHAMWAGVGMEVVWVAIGLATLYSILRARQYDRKD
jgi:hypothetical protein